MSVEKKKKESKSSHVRFRNGDLFCYHCGSSFKMPLPAPVSMATAMMTQFEKDHRKCKKTWTEPVASTNGKSEQQNALWWSLKGEHGSSSRCIFNELSKGIGLPQIGNQTNSVPYDPDDFRRCYLLLEAVPQWKSKLDDLRKISPIWSKLVDHWPRMTELLEQAMKSESGEAAELYDLIQSCHKE